MEILFVFGWKEAVMTEVDTQSLHFISLLGVIYSSSSSSSLSLYTSTITNKDVKEDISEVHVSCGDDDGGRRRDHIRDVDNYLWQGWQHGKEERE